MAIFYFIDTGFTSPVRNFFNIGRVLPPCSPTHKTAAIVAHE